jgi:hypothetical protein
MANFRTERLLIRVAGSIDRFDPNEGVDASEFAFLMIRDQESYERTPLSSFANHPWDRPRWFRATEGLKVVREFIAELEAKLKSCSDDRRSAIETDLQTLRAVEDRLDIIDTHDLKFHFLARDLE